MRATPAAGQEQQRNSYGNGGHLPLGEFRWVFDQAVAATGLDGMVPHGLRHTAASLAISAGANIKVVQKMLGHKTATLTLDLYGHLFDDDLDPVADAMNRGALTAADSLRTEGVDAIEPGGGEDDLPAA
ncbi:tyrosine-type recombinase/integrase [Nocardia asteroides]